MGRAEPVEVRAAVGAPPEKLYELVADLPRMGEWSPECRRVSWKRGASAARPGARFRGHNKQGWHRWSTSGRVVAADPGKKLAWDVSFLGLPMSRWTYEFQPDGDGCRVTERWEDRQIFLSRPWVVGWLVTGVRRRPGRNEDTMRETLDRLGAAVAVPSTR